METVQECARIRFAQGGYCRLAVWLLPLALLTACASAPAPSNPNSGRYSISQDRAPNRSVDPASIPEVIPVALNRGGAGNRSPYTVLGKTYSVLPTEEGYSERGVASWYGEKFHGHKTSNGEVFDMYQATAAHKSLPIPSFLRVTNLENNRSLVVRVNDRGPFHGDRLIDLSYGAALKLGFADRGTARVQLDSIVVNGESQRVGSRTIATNGPSYGSRPVGGESSVDALGSPYLQVGAFSKLESAQRVADDVGRLTSLPVFIRSVQTASNGLMHRVRVGPFATAGDAQRLARRLEAARLGSPYAVYE